MTTHDSHIILIPDNDCYQESFFELELSGLALRDYSLSLARNLHINETIAHYEHSTDSTENNKELLSIVTQIPATNYIVIPNNMPLITPHDISHALKFHNSHKGVITVLTSYISNSYKGYFPIIKKEQKLLIEEQRDGIGTLESPCLVTTGIYILAREYLLSMLHKNPCMSLPELVNYTQQSHHNVNFFPVAFDNVRKIKTPADLWEIEHILRSRIISYWMSEGIRFESPLTTIIDRQVIFESPCFIGSQVHILKDTKIGKETTINAGSYITNSYIGNNVTIHPYSVITSSIVKDNSEIGPFAHLRNGSTIGNKTIIGNFVEVNATTIGNKTKAKHLSYLGNALIGTRVNIGAGTITCNYDGNEKHLTRINNDAFIGSNNSLIAPLTIGEASQTAAGSTITEDVPENSLAIARNRQVNKIGYTLKRKNRSKSTETNTNS